VTEHGGDQPEERVSAVIVNYNTRRHLLECVRSLREEGVTDVIVADNGSRDGSAEAVSTADPEVTVVHTGGNLGYGGGANRGSAVARGDVLLVCNADVRIEPGAVKSLVAALDADPHRAVVGPLIEDREGSIYPSPREFPSVVDALGHGFIGLVAPGNRFSRRYRMLDSDRSAVAEADWVSGSCFLVRRRAWEVLGGFDESYFMFAEDVDLCWRAWRSGWTVAFEPAARVVHVRGASTDLAPYRMIVVHHRSLLTFAHRTLVGWRRCLLPVVALGLVARAALACAQRATGRG
jgi:N-acetylglucosaminyl-diphospho-decaprenol L-rhamnosyltransferase